MNALRRFLCRRGHVRSIRSDNGTNFVGAQNELQRQYEWLDKSKLKDLALEHDVDIIEWKRNPPKGSHMGGIWERAIRSVRAIFSGILLEYSRVLTDEMLSTFMCEAESIVNCRPITVESLTDPDINVLTPNHLLTMKPR